MMLRNVTALLTIAFIVSGAQTHAQKAPNAPVATSDVSEQEIPITPMTTEQWRAMSEEGKTAYAKVTVTGLRWSPLYAACKDLTYEVIKADFDAYAEEETGIILNAMAITINRSCMQ